MPGRRNEADRSIAEYIGVVFDDLGRIIAKRIVELRGITMVREAWTEHRFIFLSLHDPLRSRKQPRVSDMVEMSMRQDQHANVAWIDTDFRQLGNERSLHDAANAMGNDLTARHIRK